MSPKRREAFAGEIDALRREHASLVQMSDAIDRESRIKDVAAELRSLGVEADELETTRSSEPKEQAVPPKVK